MHLIHICLICMYIILHSPPRSTDARGGECKMMYIHIKQICIKCMPMLHKNTLLLFKFENHTCNLSIRIYTSSARSTIRVLGISELSSPTTSELNQISYLSTNARKLLNHSEGRKRWEFGGAKGKKILIRPEKFHDEFTYFSSIRAVLAGKLLDQTEAHI